MVPLEWTAFVLQTHLRLLSLTRIAHLITWPWKFTSLRVSAFWVETWYSQQTSPSPSNSSVLLGKSKGKGVCSDSQESPESSGKALHRYPGIQEKAVLFILTASVANANCPSPLRGLEGTGQRVEVCSFGWPQRSLSSRGQSDLGFENH